MLTIGRIAELWERWVTERDKAWWDELTVDEREYVEFEEERFWASIGGKPREEEQKC